MHVDGGAATWQGTAVPSLELEMAFRAPLPLRLWRDLSRRLP